MLIQVQGLPPCHRCGLPSKVQKIGPEGYVLWFVVCDSEACTVRKDNGLRTAPTPLSNGKPSQNEAEEAWRAEVRKHVASGVPGYRLT